MRARIGSGALALALAATAVAQDARSAVAARPFVGARLDPDTLAEGIALAVPRRFRQVGTSSVTLRIDLGADLAAAYKPRTRGHPRGYASEVAAYRLARLLDMDNVPPAVFRRLPRPLLQERFESEHPEDWEPIRREILWDAPGYVRGAAIYWIPNMERTPLADGLDGARVWLRVGGAVPEGARATARDLSTMLAFDYLIGNWDRFSGGNVSTDGAGRLFVRDHNVAFQAPLPEGRYARIRSFLERAQRFSRRFVERVRVLDRASLEAAMVEEAEGHPLLGADQIDGVLSRRRAFLSYVGALVDVHGEAAVLFWE